MLASSASAQTQWSCAGQAATIVGTTGNDTLRGTPGADVIVARQGNDVIEGLGGDDIVCAGKGDDEVFGGDGFDIVFGAQGDDTIYAAGGATAALRSDSRGARMFGGAGNDIIHGSTKWDRMQGGLGQDILFGYEGRDWMRAGGGNDVVDGGLGIDDLHGGNGHDIIELTAGDVVKGGAGLDECNISDGQPGRVRSCERQSEETTPTVTTAGVVVTGCDASSETVQLTNNDPRAITLTDWTLEDEGPNFAGSLDTVTIEAGQTVTLLFGTGPDRPGTIRIFDRNIWNNGGDTAFLMNPDGVVVSEFEC